MAGLGPRGIGGGGYNNQSAASISVGGFSRHRASCLFSDSASKSFTEKNFPGKNLSGIPSIQAL